MSKVNIPCPHCEASVKVDATLPLAGQRCKKCGGRLDGSKSRRRRRSRDKDKPPPPTFAKPKAKVPAEAPGASPNPGSGQTPPYPWPYPWPPQGEGAAPPGYPPPPQPGQPLPPGYPPYYYYPPGYAPPGPGGTPSADAPHSPHLPPQSPSDPAPDLFDEGSEEQADPTPQDIWSEIRRESEHAPGQELGHPDDGQFEEEEDWDDGDDFEVDLPEDGYDEDADEFDDDPEGEDAEREKSGSQRRRRRTSALSIRTLALYGAVAAVVGGIVYLKFFMKSDPVDPSESEPGIYGGNGGGTAAVVDNRSVDTKELLASKPLIDTSHLRNEIDKRKEEAAAKRAAEEARRAADAPPPLTEEEQALYLESQQKKLARIRKAGENFLQAASVEEKLKFVRHPEQTKPLMENYYRTREAGPVAFQSIAPNDQLDTQGEFHFVSMEGEDFSVQIMAFEETPDGLKLDWESFVGYSDMEWSDFRRLRPDTPKLFRVRVVPDDYYNYEFRNPKEFACYRLTPLSGPIIYGYVRHDSPTGREMDKENLSRKLEYMPMVLRLRYPTGAESDNQVEIVEMVNPNWLIKD